MAKVRSPVGENQSALASGSVPWQFQPCRSWDSGHPEPQPALRSAAFVELPALLRDKFSRPARDKKFAAVGWRGHRGLIPKSRRRLYQTRRVPVLACYLRDLI